MAGFELEIEKFDGLEVDVFFMFVWVYFIA